MEPLTRDSEGKHTPTFRIWVDMRRRCLNPSRVAYPDYGGRGIKVCDRWLKFENFLEDMGERPEGLTLERKDNDGPYSKDNCRWATPLEQCQNRRNTVLLSYEGKTQSMAAWAREVGLKRGTLFWRLKQGWPVEQALAVESGPGGCNADRQV